MIKLVLKTILFFTSFFILLLILTITTNYNVEKNANFKINSNYKYAMFGHSHPECAYNDSLIFNFRNFSESGESYFYTYQKVKKIISQNPHIQVVFIEFSNNQINESMNNWIWGEELMSYRYPKYSAFMEPVDHLLLFTKNFVSFSNSLSLSLKNNISRIIKNDYSFNNDMGGYLYLVRDKTDSILSVLEKHPNKTNDINISTHNIHYLKKIIAFCHSNNKTIYLIRSPLHEKYPGLNNKKKYSKFIETSFDSIQYLDFCNFPLTNSEFGDLEHLNYKGAKIYSIWFDNLLKDNFLSNENKQEFIHRRIRKLILSRKLDNKLSNISN